MPSDQSTLEQISHVIRGMEGVPADVGDRISPDTDIVRDLKLDSIAVMDFVMALETRFNLIIPIDAVARVRTVGDLADLLDAGTHEVRH